MLRAPYRGAAAMPGTDAPAFVHECGDVLVRLDGPAGASLVRLDPQTVEIQHERRWLHDLSIPLYTIAFLAAACESGALTLMSRTLGGLPKGALRVLWLPAVLFAIASFATFDPAARRIRIFGSTRGGRIVAANVVFDTARGARRFAKDVEQAKQARAQ